MIGIIAVRTDGMLDSIALWLGLFNKKPTMMSPLMLVMNI